MYFDSGLVDYHDKLVESLHRFELGEAVDEQGCVVFTRQLCFVQCFQVCRQVVNALSAQKLETQNEVYR